MQPKRANSSGLRKQPLNSIVAQAKQELLEIQEPMIINKTGGHSTFNLK
jgi:hypothetical protein